MSKKVKKLKQDISDIIYKFFDGDIYKITKSKLSDLYNNPQINKDFKIITESNFKELKKIEKIIRGKKDIRIILRDPPEEEEIIEIKEEEEKEEDIIEYKDFKGDKYVSYQRKAFIDFINNYFYKDIIQETKNSDLKIYQNFVKGYLGLETPYRGLLVYHGLGTGKTATAVSTAEGLSENMEIFTLLPASLETNFVNEIKRWGEDLFDLRNNNWVFVSEKEILEDTKLRIKLFEKYKITPEIIKKLFIKSKNSINTNLDRI